MWKSLTNQVTDKMKVAILKTDGTSSGKEAELLDTVFGIEPNETILYEDVRRILANRRQGTAKTKERSEVRGGGRKAYKQKGTGMARSEERRVGKEWREERRTEGLREKKTGENRVRDAGK